jgi:hypothetical protein
LPRLTRVERIADRAQNTQRCSRLNSEEEILRVVGAELERQILVQSKDRAKLMHKVTGSACRYLASKPL